MFHSGVEFVPLFDCCGLTNVISEFILIFKRSKNSTPKEKNFADDEGDDGVGDGGGGNVGGDDGIADAASVASDDDDDGDAEGCSNNIQWYVVLNIPQSDAFSVEFLVVIFIFFFRFKLVVVVVDQFVFRLSK